MDVDSGQATPLDVIESGPEVEEFANALDDCLAPLLKPAEKRRRLLELPQKYYDNATKRLSHLDPQRARLSYDDMDVEGDDGYADDAEERAAEASRVEKEVQTWDLFRRLLPLRYAEQQNNGLSLRWSTVAQPGPADLLHEFLETDKVAQERRAVLQWLQNNTTSRPDIDDLVHDLQQNADRGDIIAHGWLHTRSSIKLRKGVTSWSGLLDKQSATVAESHSTNKGDPLVTQLDPDAITRQNRKLQPQDEYFERAIWLGCFEHLRRGSSMKTIREWCQERTEMWRAISMSALLLSVDDKESVPETDASSLALWRRMCFGLARQGGTDDYERAVYGVLSGDILSVEKVAQSWDDRVFAKYNSLLRTQFDQYLLSRCTADVAADLTRTFSTYDSVQSHNDRDANAQFIKSLAAHPEFGKEAREPNKALQAALIAGEVEQYLDGQGRAISQTADKEDQMVFAPVSRTSSDAEMDSFFRATDFDGVRIVAHIYLLLTLLDGLDGEEESRSTGHIRDETQGNTLAGYTAFLRRANLKELIPLYCSVLDTPRRYAVLTSNMIHESDPDARRNQLRLMKKVGIDIAEYVGFQAAFYFKGIAPAKPSAAHKRKLSVIGDSMTGARAGRGIKADFFGQDEDEVEELHQYMARSLEWMMLIDETWPDVFAYGAQAYKFFLGNMHLSAARHLLERVTTSDIFKAMGLSAEEIDDYTFSDLNFWSTQLADHGIEKVSPQKVMMDARNFRELEALVRVLDNLETIGSLVALSEEAPVSNRDYWTKMGNEVKATKDSMQPLLSEWLLTGIAAGDKELLRLRQTYLTETILAYVSALHFAGTSLSRDYHLECMELASTIAEGESDLAAAFMEAGRMRELVEAFAACSKALAVATGGGGRSAGVSNKKLREMGWSRDLWSVKS